MMPRVSVVMSVFNAEPYLREAIDSILNQTFTDFELIIVDDGSTDGSSGVLKSSVQEDKRIHLMSNASNLGLIAALNKGIRLAKGEYIARQDADDASMRRRLERQVAFLDKNPDIGVVGTWMVSLQENGHKSVYKTPLTDALIRWSLLFHSPMAHASVMMRRSLFLGGVAYNEKMRHAEDYDLWCQLSRKTRFQNLSECLYLRRKHKNRVSVRHSEAQRATWITVMHRQICEMLGANMPKEAVLQLSHAFTGGSLSGSHQVHAVARLFCKLYGTFLKTYGDDCIDFRDVRKNAATFLARLGLRHMTHCPITSGIVFFRSLRLYRGVPFNACVAEAFSMARKLGGDR
jgi:glycosyltransferase involved in cell wall biosynthesis